MVKRRREKWHPPIPPKKKKNHWLEDRLEMMRRVIKQWPGAKELTNDERAALLWLQEQGFVYSLGKNWEDCQFVDTTEGREWLSRNGIEL